ncbi:MAG: cell division protein FtsW [Bacteroidetes bacterium]|jgi:cell division protein FtsW|nr:cell division protein FtsW [Bacteroidota bacterium]MBO6057797.1 cell division protein FtsW [Bacteroidales bacterium]
MIDKETVAEKTRNLFQGDKVIWVVVAILTFISLLTVYSASESVANRSYNGNNAFVLLRHAVMLLLGLACMFGASRINYKMYSKLLLLLFWIAIPLLIYTLFFGKNLNHAQRVIGIAGVTFQTSDLAKIALIGFLARVLTLRRDELDDFKELGIRVMLPILVIVGLIFPENFSTAAMLFATCIVMMFLSKVKMKYIFGFIGIIMLAGGIFMLVSFAFAKDNRSATWVNRIERFFSSSEEEADDTANFQVMQSKIAIAGGGLIGKSPGKSTQRNVLPHPYSDFIYAIVLEEYGLIGGIFVLALYLILLYRATRIILRAPQSFGGLLAMGLAFSLVMQAMVNMGVAVGLFPVTGQPLPFISMGGTSLLFTGLSIGIIISVTREINKVNNDERDAEIEVAEADS